MQPASISDPHLGPKPASASLHAPHSAAPGGAFAAVLSGMDRAAQAAGSEAKGDLRNAAQAKDPSADRDPVEGEASSRDSVGKDDVAKDGGERDPGAGASAKTGEGARADAGTELDLDSGLDSGAGTGLESAAGPDAALVSGRPDTVSFVETGTAAVLPEAVGEGVPRADIGLDGKESVKTRVAGADRIATLPPGAIPMHSQAAGSSDVDQPSGEAQGAAKRPIPAPGPAAWAGAASGAMASLANGEPVQPGTAPATLTASRADAASVESIAATYGISTRDARAPVSEVAPAKITRWSGFTSLSLARDESVPQTGRADVGAQGHAPLRESDAARAVLGRLTLAREFSTTAIPPEAKSQSAAPPSAAFMPSNKMALDAWVSSARDGVGLEPTGDSVGVRAGSGGVDPAGAVRATSEMAPAPGRNRAPAPMDTEVAPARLTTAPSESGPKRTQLEPLAGAATSGTAPALAADKMTWEDERGGALSVRAETGMTARMDLHTPRAFDAGAAPPNQAQHPAAAAQARSIAQQVAQQLPSSGGGFQINLNPEELGHVHMRLIHADNASTLFLHADRPETMDLMRRHIGQLEQDLRAMGHPHLNLRFSGGGSDQPAQQRSEGGGDTRIPTRPTDPTPATTTPSSTAMRTDPLGASRDHLDMRL